MSASLFSRCPLEATNGYVERIFSFHFPCTTCPVNKPVDDAIGFHFLVILSSMYHYSYTYMLPFLPPPVRHSTVISRYPTSRLPFPSASFHYSLPFSHPLNHIATVSSNPIKKARSRNRTPDSQSILRRHLQSVKLCKSSSYPIQRFNYLFFPSNFLVFAYSSLFSLLPF